MARACPAAKAKERSQWRPLAWGLQVTGRMEGRIRGTKRKLCGKALSPLSSTGGTAQPRADSWCAAQSSPSHFFPCTRTREKWETSASTNVTSMDHVLVVLLHLLPSASRDRPHTSLTHLAALGHRRALCPLQSSRAGICGVGGNRHQAASLIEQEAGST